jgi:hypothetical protein
MFYCSRQSAASARLVELQADPSYAAYLNECWGLVKARTHAWNLDSMLIKPVQRITKYPLLFEDLLTCTMPSHADYHAIRSSAESARSLALDIDEAKRRKDVITSVIGKSSSTINLMKDGRGNGATGRGGLLLRRFKKDKSTPLSAGISPSDPMGPPPEIAPYSQAQLKELVHRLENSDRNIRRLGKEFVDWVAATKVMLRQEIEIQSRLVTWYGIDDKDKEPHIEKVVQYKALLEDMLTNSLEQVNAEVSNSVLPMVGKLIDAATNPTTIIEKLNKKAADYGRYIAHRNAKKAVPDRMLLQEATDYVAIHTQLLEELPAFLDGYTKIIDIAVATFTMAQMRYYGTFRARLTDFSERYLTVPTEQIADADGIRDALIDLSNIRGIHRAWVGAFREPNNAMKSLECTSGDMSRMGSASRANSRRMNSSSRPASRASGVGSNLIYPPLQHTSSLSSQQSRTPTEDSQSTGGRRRSSSLTAAYDTVRSTGSEGRSGLSGIMWRGSRNNSATNLAGLVNATPNRARTNLSILPLNRSKSRNKTHSIASQEEEGRQSFGLPRIPMNDSLFDSLTSASPSPSPARNSGASYSDSSETHFSALGFGEPAGMHSHSHSLSHSLGDSVAESWRNSPVLYQCAAVADFLPIELGNHKFQGLYFLPLVAGDLVE